MYDAGYLNSDNEWIVDGQASPIPYPVGTRVRLASTGQTGTVTDLAQADDYTFRIELDDGDWTKQAAWELEPLRG